MGKPSRKKSGWKPLEIPIVIPKEKAPNTETMDYKESFKYKSWAMERELADKILTNLKKKGLNFKLDDLTQGKGSCFMVAILQQMKRRDVQVYLSEEQKAIKNSLEFRWCVNRFRIRNANHEKLQNMKMLYKATSPKVPWEVYWREMTVEKPIMEWADGWFIQVTAWYLGLDLDIYDTACEEWPYITVIEGNIDNPEDGPPVQLDLGYLHNAHYQSLLWDEEMPSVDPEPFPPAEWDFDWRKELEERFQDVTENENVTPGFEKVIEDETVPPDFEDAKEDKSVSLGLNTPNRVKQNNAVDAS